MITEVQCFKTPSGGIQLVFMNDYDLADVFTFNNDVDVEYIMSLIRIEVPCETLLVEARDRTQITVH